MWSKLHILLTFIYENIIFRCTIPLNSMKNKVVSHLFYLSFECSMSTCMISSMVFPVELECAATMVINCCHSSNLFGNYGSYEMNSEIWQQHQLMCNTSIDIWERNNCGLHMRWDNERLCHWTHRPHYNHLLNWFNSNSWC